MARGHSLSVVLDVNRPSSSPSPQSLALNSLRNGVEVQLPGRYKSIDFERNSEEIQRYPSNGNAANHQLGQHFFLNHTTGGSTQLSSDQDFPLSSLEEPKTKRQPPSTKAELELIETAEANMKVRLPDLVRQFTAEVLGTFLLVLFGDGSIAQVVIGGGSFQSIMFGYGFALAIGIYASGGISGGHLNPAVTLTMAVFRKCRWIQVPVYMLGQYLGAFLAAAVLYGVYADGINAVGGKTAATAGIFASYPTGAFDASTATLAFDQIIGTALLLVIIFAVTDERNMNIPSSMFPLYIGLGLSAIHNSFGLNAGCAINPARDFSPRLLTLMAGWSSQDTFRASNSFFWIPWILPHLGGVLGGGLYQFMIAMHHPDDN